MKIVFVIPARGGSKRLPRKNIYNLLGRPLIDWSIQACKGSKYYEGNLYVSSEDREILELSESLGAKTIQRPDRLSEDGVWTQEVLKHAVDSSSDLSECEIVVRIQANSPQIKSEKIDECIEKLIEYNLWEVFTVDERGIEDAAIHVLRRECVNQEALSVYKGVVETDYIDIHTKEDIQKVSKLMKIHELNCGPGYIILKNIGYEKFLNTCEHLGNLRSQNNKGEKIITVKNRGVDMNSGGRYHQGNSGGSIHTDSPHWEEVVDYVGLYCKNPAQEGGESLLCSTEKIYKEMLQSHPKYVKILKECFYFDKKEYKQGESKTIFKPILFEKGGKICFRYLRDYIESGYVMENKQMSSIQIEALDCLDNLIRQNTITLKLQKNDAIIFNNLRVLHGRTGFTDNENNKRNLKRIWLCKH